MSLIKNPGRAAGVLYLLLVLAAPLRLLIIPGKLFVHGDAGATAANIAAHESLFRLGIVSDLFCGCVLVFLTLALYRLFRDVDKNLAVLMVILGGVLPATIDFVNALNDSAALILVRGEDFLSVFEKPQRDALALLFLRLHHQEIIAAEFLWGLWLLPLGTLVFRSQFLPRFLGVWLILNGVAYVLESVVGLMLPKYEGKVSNALFALLLGEVAFMLWLVIKGVRKEVTLMPAPRVE